MTTYYVSESGDDTSTGTSSVAPWRSLQKGFDTLVAGDTLYVMTGTYVPGEEGESFYRIDGVKGTAAKPVLIKNYNGQTVTIDGQESGESSGYPSTGVKLRDKSVGYYQWTWVGLLEIVNCTYLTVDGIDV